MNFVEALKRTTSFQRVMTIIMIIIIIIIIVIIIIIIIIIFFKNVHLFICQIRQLNTIQLVKLKKKPK